MDKQVDGQATLKVTNLLQAFLSGIFCTTVQRLTSM